MNSELVGIRGCLIDTPEYGKIRIWRDGALILDQGHIAEIGDYETVRKKPRTQPLRWIHHPQRLILPGLIDLHAHLPQYPAVARAERDLLPWLREHIFPLERDFTGPKGRKQAAAFFPELARHGTTTALLHAGIYEDTCDAAFAAAEQSGLRIIMGQTMIDTPCHGPLQPKKVASIALLESERLCKQWHGANHGLLEYAFTPRFAPGCSEKLLRGAADLARQYQTHLQTHLAENREEIEKVRAQYTWAQDYTEIYETFGLLTSRTLLAHALHLTPREREAITASGAAIVHCPTANLFLGSGLLPLDRILASRTPLGLGSDIGTGPELNLWHVMRSCIETQQIRAYYEPNIPVPTPAQAFHLATQGAAHALGKGHLIGSLDIGKEADLIVIDPAALLPHRKASKGPNTAGQLSDLSAEDLLTLCIYRGGPHALIETFVRGRSLHRAPQPELF
jgi:guanine deaminase